MQGVTDPWHSPTISKIKKSIGARRRSSCGRISVSGFSSDTSSTCSLGFPLGFYMAAQGSLIAFVVMLFCVRRQQDKIDRDHGYAEDD
jgi:putative solute:sodium symporter small subunit